jgi:hypothetical protein
MLSEFGSTHPNGQVHSLWKKLYLYFGSYDSAFRNSKQISNRHVLVRAGTWTGPGFAPYNEKIQSFGRRH